MSADGALQRLMNETRALVAKTPDLSAFIGDLLEELPYHRPVPASLPVTPDLAGRMPAPGATTTALTRAVLAASPYLHWDQTYREEQVGADYLANYGWFNIAAPDGPFESDATRVSVGFWGEGLRYPQHRHAPEEIYCVLAGNARFETAGRAPKMAGPGDLIHHPPNVLHGFDMQRSALLAIAFWKGASLLAPSTLEGEA